ncbi:TonB-dependent receptor [Sphingomonas floccifaciens]|uniref:TonB-dependent receptor n=1 Tax=Sphingomonas floccifaciens TaxID=1844115 RepID=A0ABW4NAS6_9SPHN
MAVSLFGASVLAAIQTAPTVPPPAAPPTLQFNGPDGKPLPEDIQRQLRERYKDAPPPPRPPRAEGEVVVTGQRPRGSVIGDIPPERTLSAVDIRSYGAGTVAELIQTLGAQVASGRSREDSDPIVLLNGRRVSSFAEIARLPTEAIERTEILPEEVALKYGYPADRKVVNVVAFERYSSRIGQLSLAAPTEGGMTTTGGSASYLRLRGDTRTMVDADISRTSALLESERDVIQPSGTPLLADYRTLIPATTRFGLGGTIAGTPLKDVAATLNARFDATRTRALIGLGGDGPLRRDGETGTAHLGSTVSGRAGSWQWTATGNLDRTATQTVIDLGRTTPGTTARSVNLVANADLLVAGTAFTLPAGRATLSLRSGFATRDFEGRSDVGGVTRTNELARDTGSIQANLDLPIAGTTTPALAWLGTLSASVNAAVERVSDVGTLRTLGYGLNWTPAPALSLLVSLSDAETAPTLEQLGNPPVVVPNIRTFDLRRGETVDVPQSLGGNAALRPDDRHVLSLGATYRPIAKTDLTLSLDYIRTRIDDPIAAFPLVSPLVEAAFPERVIRDTNGRLQRIDATPLNFARSDQQQLRWGLSFMKPLGPLPPGAANANVRTFSSEEEMRRRLPPGAQIMRVEAGSPGARRYENMTSRLMLSVRHSWRLQDSVLLRDGGPTLDLLDGGALDIRGGRSRHEIEVQAGAFKRGLGARITANWQSGTTVQAAGGSAGDLRFGDLATVNLNLFANPADYIGRSKAPAWLKGTRLTFGVTNLFNTRRSVRDGSGATPIGYQGAYLNPTGRTVAISLRKVL